MKARILVLSALLAVAGLAHAELDHDGIVRPGTQQNLARKPYTAPVVKSESFEGAVVKEEVEQPKKLRTFMLDRRPYTEKAAD